jgi:hypothetical protein
MASAAHGRQELRLAVLQCLPPLRVAGTHREDPMAQIERFAMISQGTPRQLGPVLPKSSKGALSFPGALQRLDTPQGAELAAAAAAPTPLPYQKVAVGIEGLAP